MEGDASAERTSVASKSRRFLAVGMWVCPAFCSHHRPEVVLTNQGLEPRPKPKGTCSLYRLIT